MARFRERYSDITDHSNIEQLWLDFANGLVSEDALREAVDAGIAAVPDNPAKVPADASKVVSIWSGKARKYAKQFPARAADRISQAAADAEAEAAGSDLSVEEKNAAVLSAVDAAIEASRYEASLYAEPPWSGGNQGYGDTLGASGVMLDWVADLNACDICAPIEKGNPYTLDAMPMWPGDPHPNCRCYVTPDDVSWEAIFGEAAA